MKLGLGTVQFGTDYGVSNPGGRTPEPEVARVLALAARSGIRVLDTASAYGEAESVLGRTMPDGAAFRIVTKTPAFGRASVTAEDADELERAFAGSLERLRLSSAYGLLAHSADDLLADGGERLFDRMLALKARGLVERVGASVYTGAQIDALLERYTLDLVQLPLNVFDQRLLAGGQLARLREAGVEVHVRSVFLQGALLMPPDTLPPHLLPLADHLRRYRVWLDDLGLRPTQAALGFVLGLPEVDVVLVGVNDARQLEELVAAASPLDSAGFAPFALADERVLDPRTWGS